MEAVKKQEGGLYQKVSCRLLDNSKAKKDAILDGLDWLEHETTGRDVAMVFLSGHGIKNPRDGTYQFLPHDADPARMNRTTVDDKELKMFLGTIAGKTVLFLDTCHSGKLMSGQKGDTRPDTDRLANELAEADMGVIVFASSTGKQFSKEDMEWGNGAFTRALIEGIAGQADYTKDGHVSIAELEVWIPDKVKKLAEGSQTPVTAKPKAVEDLKVFHVINEKKGKGGK
ncbi:MAG: peptidase caspase catalytic subunit p20 [Candidatus Brocadiaceae bacterium]|nr:peptidase caspase catalytic subunit p20 [Candidatus Brocadiaceae bacterium]